MLKTNKIDAIFRRHSLFYYERPFIGAFVLTEATQSRSIESIAKCLISQRLKAGDSPDGGVIWALFSCVGHSGISWTYVFPPLAYDSQDKQKTG